MEGFLGCPSVKVRRKVRLIAMLMLGNLSMEISRHGAHRVQRPRFGHSGGHFDQNFRMKGGAGLKQNLRERKQAGMGRGQIRRGFP